MTSRSARLALLVVVIVVTQVSVFPHIRLAGVVPGLGLLVALAGGYHEGPEGGAAVGFAAGFGCGGVLAAPPGAEALRCSRRG